MTTNELIERYLNLEMSSSYVARLTNAPEEQVRAVQTVGVVNAEQLYPEPPPRPKVEQRVYKREDLKSKLRYPPLTGNETVEQLIRRGMSAKKIKARLGVGVTERQINRYGKKLLGQPQNSLSTEYALKELRPYVEACLAWLGRDPFWCECCEERQTDKCVIHHTKYDGCTIYDLAYICTSCNLARGNVGLA